LKLVQLLLPITDNSGKKFQKEIFADIKAELTDKFQGVTAFSQAPAEGIWKDEYSIMKEQIILYEIMVANVDKKWWTLFTKRLEVTLKQQKIVLRWFDISTLA
jgi:hypothetical protein